MNGKSSRLGQPVAHAVPSMQSTNMSKITVTEMRRYFNQTASSFPFAHEAKPLIDKMRPLLADGGFDIRQWASNAAVI